MSGPRSLLSMLLAINPPAGDALILSVAREHAGKRKAMAKELNVSYTTLWRIIGRRGLGEAVEHERVTAVLATAALGLL